MCPASGTRVPLPPTGCGDAQFMTTGFVSSFRGQSSRVAVMADVLTASSIGAAKGGGYARYLESKTVEPDRGDYYLNAEGEPTQAPGRWLASRATRESARPRRRPGRRAGFRRADGGPPSADGWLGSRRRRDGCPRRRDRPHVQRAEERVGGVGSRRRRAAPRHGGGARRRGRHRDDVLDSSRADCSPSCPGRCVGGARRRI